MIESRIKELMKLEELTPGKMAERIAVQQSALSHILSGRNKPGFDFISKILLAFPDLNPRWLLLGVQPVYTTNSPVTLNSLNLADNQEVAHTADLSLDFSVVGKTAPPLTDYPAYGNAPAMENPNKNDQPTNDLVQSKIERVLVFYQNGTFQEYKPR